MIFLLAAIGVEVASWAVYPMAASSWTLLVGAQALAIAILFSAGMALTQQSTLALRSVLAIAVLSGWGDVVVFVAWQLTGQSIDVSGILATLFSLWMLHAIARKYPPVGGELRFNEITLLALKPRSALEVLKALFGHPSASICIFTHGYLWAFHRRTGKYEKRVFDPIVLKSHVVVNTKVIASPVIIEKLNALVGTRRSVGVKCVWVVRHVLNEIGGQFAIHSVLDYIPGMYLLRIGRA